MKSQRGAFLNAKTNNSFLKKFQYFSKIKNFGSFFDFHTKWPKLQNREMHLIVIKDKGRAGCPQTYFRFGSNFTGILIDHRYIKFQIFGAKF